MMIKLAKHAEANAKLQPKKGGKGAINITQKWLYVLFVVLLAFQIYLNIAAYYAMLQGMKNYSLFITGIIMLVFGAMFHMYRYGRTLAKAPPPKPTPPAGAKPIPVTPKPAPAAPSAAEKPLAAPPTASAGKASSQQTPQLSQQQQKHAAAGTGAEGKTAASALAGMEAKPPTTTSSSAGLDGPDKAPKTVR
jgi:ubiquinol-cytochrome c reductase cytochrome b subunit